MARKNESFYIYLKRQLKYLIVTLFGTKKYDKLVILGRQRTGSSLLMMQLHSHPKIDMESEVFRLLKGKSCKRVWQETFSKKLPWIKYAGFKLFYNHPDDSDDREVWKILKADTSIKIIHIKRENLLRTYISKLVALKTGAWNTKEESEKTMPLDKRVTVDLAHCLSQLRNIKKMQEEYSQGQFPEHKYMELKFENLVQNMGEQMKEVFTFLDLEKTEIDKFKSSLKRQNPEKIKNLVTNYPELKEALSNSEFASMLIE